jgi:hypothetical protein
MSRISLGLHFLGALCYFRELFALVPDVERFAEDKGFALDAAFSSPAP